ncbi:hypothetical protein ARAM_001639 [Aspergillus rambellii]|uniref:Fungal-type protein kinase domain-containing protein n=1 Tax=Aspergillus rambellii TaxID=308745 RepID=A0A0F8X7U1_9EURO|nr:hypothetical protein ARAM_001639 [Aspergillus rambellii]
MIPGGTYHDRSSKVPIGNGLNGFHATFTRICEAADLPPSDEAVDQLKQKDAQYLAFTLLTAVQFLPTAHILPSRSGEIIRSTLLRLSAVASEDFDFERIKPLLQACVADAPGSRIFDQLSLGGSVGLNHSLVPYSRGAKKAVMRFLTMDGKDGRKMQTRKLSSVGLQMWPRNWQRGIASERFDINVDGIQFVSTILGVLRMSEEQCGFDPSIKTRDGQKFIELERNGQTERLVLEGG